MTDAEIYMKRKGYNLVELNQLTYSQFLYQLKTNYIMDLNETEEGKELLKEYNRLHNTKLDYDAIKSLGVGYKTI